MTEESQATSSTQEITQLAPHTPPRPPDSSSAEVLVGRQLRHLRHTRGLSLRTLADQSGLNINTLSLIENGKSSPSVSTLQLLSQALDVPIAFFFESEPIKKKVVYQPKDQRSRSLLQDKSLENLGKDLAGSAVQPFIVHLKSGAGSGRRPIVHTGYEFVYCLSGSIQYQVEQEDYPLQTGDSLLFESNLPHRWKNVHHEESSILLIFFPTDQRDTPSQIHFQG
jgi:transcriptional regulator with XRE-family HTH domain